MFGLKLLPSTRGDKRLTPKPICAVSISLGKLQLTDDSTGLLLAPCFVGVAQLVEHHLAKVDVESSSLFARSSSLAAPATPSAAHCCQSKSSSASRSCGLELVGDFGMA